ncbi:MAG TPA: ABC transporter ATP-binding protein [Caldilineaceae bacterium]|nr:ABC transporter ATP-binding protein [Caldilineaceae bacterium]
MRDNGLRFLLPYMRPYRNLLLLGTFYALLSAGASAFSPTLLGWGIDELTRNVTAQKLALYALGLVALSATMALFRYLLRMLTGDIAAGVSYRMSQDLFHRLLLFDYETRQQYGTGDLLSRATNDFIYIWRFYSAGFQMTMHALFLLIIGAALMAITSPAMSGLVVVMLAVSIFLQMRLGGMMQRSFVHVQEEAGKISEFVQEHLNAARMLTAYAQEQAVGDAFRTTNRSFVEKNMHFVVRSGLISPVPSLFVRIATTVVILIGGMYIINDQLTVGEYVQFIVYLELLNNGARQITGAFERLQQGSAAAARIGEVLHLLPKINDAPDAIVPQQLEGNIRFEDVSVYAEDQDRWVLRHVNLDLPAGATVGIVGPTGAGKSMLISLLGRIRDPDEGSIRLDGFDLRQIQLNALRHDVVYVPQETLLFSMPLRGNITLGAPTTPDPQVYRAMEQARLTNDLPQLPKGLDSIVGERGATLSGGQRQRTAIARALVRNPKVLILDDALASVDMHTSAEIINELRESTSEDARRTAIIVSQRMAAVRYADQIIVMQDGHVAEQGNHEELMERNGIYAEMYQREIEQAEEELIDG